MLIKKIVKLNINLLFSNLSYFKSLIRLKKNYFNFVFIYNKRRV